MCIYLTQDYKIIVELCVTLFSYLMIFYDVSELRFMLKVVQSKPLH